MEDCKTHTKRRFVHPCIPAAMTRLSVPEHIHGEYPVRPSQAAWENKNPFYLKKLLNITIHNLLSLTWRDSNPYLRVKKLKRHTLRIYSCSASWTTRHNQCICFDLNLTAIFLSTTHLHVDVVSHRCKPFGPPGYATFPAVNWGLHKAVMESPAHCLSSGYVCFVASVHSSRVIAAANAHAMPFLSPPL